MLAVDVDADAAVVGLDEEAAVTTDAGDDVVRFDGDGRADEPAELGRAPQGALEAGARQLQGVGPGQRVGRVERVQNRARLPIAR